jgi:hypothetical protein
VRKTIPILLGLSALLVLGCAQRGVRGVGAEGPILFKFLEGQSHTFRMAIQVRTSAEMSGMTYNILSTIEMDLVQEVESIREDSLVDLVLTFGDITATNVIEGQSAPMEEILTLEGSTLEFTLSHGKVMSSKEPEALKSIDAFGQRPFDQFEEIYSFLPRDTILRVGDSWERISELEGQRKTDTYTYEHRGIEDGHELAEFSIDSDLENRREIEFGPMIIELDLAGTGDGELLFDITEGMIISSKRSVSLDGEGSLVDVGAMAASARLSIDLDLSLELLE